MAFYFKAKNFYFHIYLNIWWQESSAWSMWWDSNQIIKYLTIDLKISPSIYFNMFYTSERKGNFNMVYKSAIFQLYQKLFARSWFVFCIVKLRFYRCVVLVYVICNKASNRKSILNFVLLYLGCKIWKKNISICLNL